MCGIGGLMMFKEEYSELELGYIRELVKQLAIENQDRGTHATGISTFNEKGDYKIIKDKQSAIDFTSTKAVSNFLKSNVNCGTTNVLIHTRLATQGTVDNNMNNHPIETPTTIGVHNGMIYNDDSMFSKYGLTRQAEVDSEVIFRLVDHFGKNGQITDEEIKNVAEEVSGSFTFAFVRKNNPFKMHIVRNDNPITMAYIPTLDIMVFASQEKYIDYAIESCNEYYWNELFIALDELVKFEPKKESIYSFDVLAPALEQFEQDTLLFKENFNGYYSYGNQWYDEWAFDRADYGVKKNAYQVVESYMDILDDTQYTELMNAMEELETNSWADGFKRGRISTEEETNSKVEKAFNEGLYQYSTDVKAN